MILLYKDLIQQYKSDYKIKKLIEGGKIAWQNYGGYFRFSY